MGKKKRRIDVMVSSTTQDLQEHRKRARVAIQRLRWTPLAMEYDEAKPFENALSYSLNLVDEAEVYVGIFGVRYGFRPLDAARNPDKRSITELEYRRAVERGIPILIFIATEEHNFPKYISDDENDADRAALKTLIEHLKQQYTASFYDAPGDFQIKLGHSLRDLQASEEFKRRYPDLDVAPDAPQKPALPKPPSLYAKPEYGLRVDFVGRTPELAQLDAWAQSDDPMMIVEAIGGMGKSALTWEWLQNQTVWQPQAQLWWSFYERGATMAAFVRHALAYLNGSDPDDYKGQTVSDLFARLQAQLRQTRTLVVLDGLERVLVAYHRWDAAQMRDDRVEASDSIIPDREIRACTDPKDDAILQGLLRCRGSKILISSRLVPIALHNRAHQLSRGVQHISLTGLAPEDALALIRQQGVRVDDEAQFQRFMRQFGYHSLMVTLIAGQVNRPQRGRGHFDAWYARVGRDLQLSDLEDDLRQNQSHILYHAFQNLTQDQRRFLSQIAAFGDALSYDTLTLFNPYAKPAPTIVAEPDTKIDELWLRFTTDKQEKADIQARINAKKATYQRYLQEKADYDTIYLKSSDYRKALSQFDELLTVLEEHGLLRWQQDDDQYDMHPIVRAYTFEHLEDDDKTITFQRIQGYFEAQTEDIESAREVADLSNTIGVYKTLLNAGQFDQAARFFHNQLTIKLKDNIAAYYTVIELLNPLFQDGADQMPTLQNRRLQGAIMTTMATMYSYIGQDDRAMHLEAAVLQLHMDEDDAVSVCVALHNYASSLKNNSQLALARRARELALELAQAIADAEEIAQSRLFLLGLAVDMGQWTEVEALYDTLQAQPPRERFWQGVVERLYADSLVRRGGAADAALEQAEQLAQQSDNALGIWLIAGLRGEVALTQGDPRSALEHFQESLRRSRKAGSSDAIMAIGGLVRAHALLGEDEEARRLIADTAFADEEIVNLAEAYLILDELDHAKRYALAAYQAAWADGKPYQLWWYLERAKAVLDALGVPYPELPAYDAARVGKFAHEDALRAYIARKQGRA